MAKFVSPKWLQEQMEMAVDQRFRGATIRFYDNKGNPIPNEKDPAIGIVYGISSLRPFNLMEPSGKEKWLEEFGNNDPKDYVKVYYGFPMVFENWIDRYMDRLSKRMIMRLIYIPIIGQRLFEMFEDYVYGVEELEFTIIKWDDGFESEVTSDCIKVLNTKGEKFGHVLDPIPYMDSEEQQVLAPFHKFFFEDPKSIATLKQNLEDTQVKLKIVMAENRVLKQDNLIRDAYFSKFRKDETISSVDTEARKQRILKDIDNTAGEGKLETGEVEMIQ